MDNKPSRGAGDFLAKNLKKQSLRAKERVLEKLGKADKTEDQRFDEFVADINKQQNNALRLQKEIRNYVTALKAMDTACKNLHDALVEGYEPEWTGQSQMASVMERLQQSRTEHLRKVNDELQQNLVQYLNQFPEIKNKIAKRGRKLVDYDAARYNLQAQLNAPKRNDAKAAKAQDELNAMQRLYESVNDELHRELPAVYESRVGFYGSALKLLWESEEAYHSEFARISHELAGYAGQLADQGRGSYSYNPVPLSARPTISGPVASLDRTLSQTREDDNAESRQRENGHGAPLSVHYQAATNTVTSSFGETQQNKEPSSPTDTTDSRKIITPSENSAFTTVKPTPPERPSSVRMYPELPGKLPDPTVEKRLVRNRPPSTSSSNDENIESGGTNVRDSVDEKNDDVVVVTRVRDDMAHPSSPKSPVSGEFATPTADGPVESAKGVSQSKVPSYRVLYKVRATNPYNAEDVDELSFDTGEIISVIPYESPEEQDEGWLMGVKESDGIQGVFPANFTKLYTS